MRAGHSIYAVAHWGHQHHALKHESEFLHCLRKAGLLQMAWLLVGLMLLAVAMAYFSGNKAVRYQQEAALEQINGG